MAHHGRAEKHDVVADREVATDGNLSRDLAALADRRASGDSRQSRDGCVRTHVYVMGDHDEVVELHALLDHGVLDSASVDRGVGTDLNIGADAHGAHLGHFYPAMLVGSESKAIAADDSARLHNGARADLHGPTESDARGEIDIFSKRDLVFQNAVGSNECPGTDDDALANHT